MAFPSRALVSKNLGGGAQRHALAFQSTALASMTALADVNAYATANDHQHSYGHHRNKRLFHSSLLFVF